MKYYIYHIPTFIHSDGRIGKIGCSEKPKSRVKGQGYSNFEILEEHTDIYVASDREQELQKQYNYPVDNVPYHFSCKIHNIESIRKVGLSNTKEHLSNIGKLGRSSHEQCVSNGKKSGAIAIASGQLDRDRIKGQKRSQEKVICEHCGKSINRLNYGVWHGPKCKKNPMTIDQ